MSSSLLFSLPTELRLQIYEYVLAPTGTLHLDSTDPEHHNVRPIVSLALLATCHKIHREAHKILYTQNSLIVVGESQAWAKPVFPESLLPQNIMNKLERICLVFDCTANFRKLFDEVDFNSLSALTNLKEVRIAVVLKTDRQVPSSAEAMRSSLGDMLECVVEKLPAQTRVELGVEAGSVEWDVAEQVKEKRQSTFRGKGRDAVVVVCVGRTELEERLAEVRKRGPPGGYLFEGKYRLFLKPSF